MTQEYCIIDYESRSGNDLKVYGPWEYSLHPNTKIFCASFRRGTKDTLRGAPIKSWSPVPEIGGPIEDLLNALTNRDVKLVAHNSLFEQAITRNTLGRMFPRVKHIGGPERWICTAAMAAAHALPRSLEGACASLGLSVRKDVEGRKLILKYTKPRRATKYDVRPWHNKLSDLKRIIEYCEHDIKAETELFLTIPELSPEERKVWLLNQRVNLRGFAVDRELVRAALDMIEIESAYLQKRTREISGGLISSTAQRDATLRFLDKEGVTLPNLQSKTIADSLKGKLPDNVRELLEIRQAASKTSTAKYQALWCRSGSDGRCRDNLMYHGASTGREAGTGINIQNLPRPVIKNTNEAAEVVKEKDIEWVRALYGSPMNALSSVLRSTIIATPGKEFFCADFNAIEVRVLFWIAGQEDGLEAYREKRDLYREMASVIYRKPLSAITDAEREVGKRAILGCGFGLGFKRFSETCEQFNMPVTDILAQTAVHAYRSTYFAVPLLWKNLERAAIYAVEHPGKLVKINRTKWYLRGKFLYCELPSGRRLAYYAPEIGVRATPWGEKKKILSFMGVDSLTKQWLRQKVWGGTWCENVIQSVARDLMVAAQLRLDEAGYEIVLSVHDEILAERDVGMGDLKKFEDVMSMVPEWGEGLPIAAKGYTGTRYRKG